MSHIERRVLIYSHDSYGLGHLRRCRAIAHSLVRHDDRTSVLILSGPLTTDGPVNDRLGNIVEQESEWERDHGQCQQHDLLLAAILPNKAEKTAFHAQNPWRRPASLGGRASEDNSPDRLF